MSYTLNDRVQGEYMLLLVKEKKVEVDGAIEI